MSNNAKHSTGANERRIIAAVTEYHRTYVVPLAQALVELRERVEALEPKPEGDDAGDS